MLAISAFARQWGCSCLALVGAGFLFTLAAAASPFRQRFDSGFLNVPLAGRLARGYNAARFAGTLAMLAGAGVPILKALQAAAETLSNHACAPTRWTRSCRCAKARRSPPRSPRTSASRAARDVRPPGEQTGQLPVMLDRAASSSQARCSGARSRSATLLEPLLIVAMGGVVMMIVLSVLLPIIQLNSFVK
jgi:general secretion pathway protein F